MQQTRLSLLASSLFNRLSDFFANPWRRLSLVFIAWLWGYVTSDLVSTSVSQAGKWDIPVATCYLILTEGISIWVYRQRDRNRKIQWLDILNSWKIGFVFGLYVSAMTLSS